MINKEYHYKIRKLGEPSKKKILIIYVFYVFFPLN